MSLRVFIDDAAAAGLTLQLDADESRYLCRVRRAQVGAHVELIDGAGALWSAQVTTIHASASVLAVEQQVATPRLVPLELALAVVDPKAALEALSRACEVGVVRVQLIACEHSQARPPSTARVQRVLKAAQRQCGRPQALEVLAPLSLQSWLESSPSGWFAWAAVRGQVNQPQRCELSPDAYPCLLIGPEGGLSPAEVTAIRAHGLAELSLGPFVLRTEVAVVAGVTRLSDVLPQDVADRS